MRKEEKRKIINEYNKSRFKYYLNCLSRRVIGKYLFTTKYNKYLYNSEEGNLLLKKYIENGEPFVAARYGGTEAKTIADILYSRAGGIIGGFSDRTIKRIMNLSGFFPNDSSMLYKFTDLYLDCSKKIDILAVWNIVMQKYLAEEVAVNAKLSVLGMFEPYDKYEETWYSALEGKNVLVVHPFVDTIYKQYQKRTELFSKPDLLPKFNLRVVKAVQTLAGEKDNRFGDWFEALEYMYTECMKEEFDIALIGCGAYGLPLACKIKEAGKQAIHIGGSLQILFGIKGARWDSKPHIARLYNDSWVRPSEEETIKNNRIVEKGCYW